MSVLSITGHGYIPPDDASRHVAKVISGKDWKDILVVREDFTMDSHPGWHWILSLLIFAVLNFGLLWIVIRDLQ